MAGGGLFDNFILLLQSNGGGSLILTVVDDQLNVLQQTFPLAPGIDAFTIDATNGESIFAVNVQGQGGAVAGQGQRLASGKVVGFLGLGQPL